ncbi:tetratricopeptide repeat protein [Streptomyces sp. OV198]|uniref:ATP-binding protein n=1 Tax=Streptomyces sp. OV198 TaxID=1882787 RepID=UPI000BE485CE|nr:tetratricopeptide repeat protein [Streptomyces sp. OV198]
MRTNHGDSDGRHTLQAGPVNNTVMASVEGPVIQAGTIGALHVQVPASPKPVPRQLPLAPGNFVGRAEEMTRLNAALSGTSDRGHSALISAVAGAGGIGKTALAIHWAHRVTDRFPDGQLYINLRGYDVGPPLSPTEALDTMLHAFDVAPEQLPRELEAKSGLLRSLLAERRMLILLDNARGAEQVRPLLTSAPGCFTLITSRSRLAGLALQVPLEQITIGTLPPTEALTLLRRIVGEERVDAEPEAARELLGYCAYLPLAIHIAADRVKASRFLRITDLADQLSRCALAELATPDDDARTTVRAVLSWSYDALTTEDQRLFRLLGLHPGQHFTVRSATALTRSPLTDVRQTLNRLAAAHLVEETSADRFQFHDLLREYAREIALAVEESSERNAAIRQLLDWYLRTTTAANRTLAPHRRGARKATSETFADHQSALDWCDTEGGNLAAATRLAVETGDDDIASELPIAMWGYLSLRKPWTIWQETHTWGLVAARRSRDRRAEAYLLTNTGIRLRDQHQPEEALAYLEQALLIRREIGDRWGEAWNLTSVGAALCTLDRGDEAIAILQEAVEIRHEVGDTQGLGRTLGYLGQAYRRVRRFREAISCFQEAHTVAQTLHNPRVLGHALQGLASAYYDLGEYESALEKADASIEATRQLGDRLGEAQSHALRGGALARLNRRADARAAWHTALRIFDELGDPQAATARSELREINTGTGESEEFSV